MTNGNPKNLRNTMEQESVTDAEIILIGSKNVHSMKAQIERITLNLGSG